MSLRIIDSFPPTSGPMGTFSPASVLANNTRDAANNGWEVGCGHAIHLCLSFSITQDDLGVRCCQSQAVFIDGVEAIKLFKRGSAGSLA